MKLLKPVAVMTFSLSLLIFGLTAMNTVMAEDSKNNDTRVFSSDDVDPALIEEDLQPEINIQQFDNREIQEYSINDHVYMIKVTPKHGFPYYLVDPDGTGEMEYKRDTLGLEVNPPQWTLFRW